MTCSPVVTSVEVALVAPETPPPDGNLLDDANVVEHADVQSVDADRFDGLVCTPHDGWKESVRRFRESNPEFPVVVTGPADPRVGALASRLGIEYAPVEAFEGTDETPWTRVLAGIERTRPEPESPTRREAALQRLLSTTRELLTVDSTDEIPDAVAEAAAEVLDLEFGLVRVYDPDRDVLYPAGTSEAVRTRMNDRPVYDADEGMPGKAFQRGEPVEYDGDEPELPDGNPAARIVPLGEYGTLTIGTTKRAGLTETDRLLISLLATSARTAFERADRIEELETYRAVHENVKQRVYVLDEDGIIRLTTDPLTNELGYTPDEVVGKPVSEFLTEEAVRTGEALLAELREDHPDASRTYETTLVARDGTEIPVEIELSLLPTEHGAHGSVGVVRNRAEIEAERARFQRLFDRSPDAIVDALMTDEGPQIRTVNRAFEETFGLDGDRVVGRSVDDLIVPDDAVTDARTLDERTVADSVQPTEVERLTAGGEDTGTFLFRGVAYRQAAEGIRAFGIYTDISDRKADERHIRMLNRVLRHNLRNVSNLVTGNLELLDGSLDDDAEAARLENALGAAERLAEFSETVGLIDRVLRSSPDDYAAVSLVPAVESAVEHAGTENENATVSLDVPRVDVVGDEALETALSELLENAVVHTGAAPSVSVSGRVVGENVVLEISDDGPGIPEMERGVITGEIDITQVSHSRGLGLWLASHVAAAVGGEFSFADDSTVVLELPLAEHRDG